MLQIVSMRRIRLFLVTTVLLAAVWFGLKEGIDGFMDAETTFQRWAAASQVLYGALAVASLGALFTGRAWLRSGLIAWSLALTMTGTVAPVAWGGAPWSAGLMAGVLTAVVAGVVTWGALAHARNA